MQLPFFTLPTQRWEKLVDRFHALDLSENAILLGFAVAVGVAGALGVVLFYNLIDLSATLLFRWPARMLPSWLEWLYRPLVTGSGLALAWYVVRRFGQGNDGLNVPDIQRAVVREAGDIPTRPALARTAAAAITIGGGGSAGAEGPVAVFGAAIGSALGRLFRFPASRTTVLVGAGAAAGISAAFNAPLAGAFFALEEILGSFSVSAFPPVVVASVVAAVVSRAVFGNHPAFPIPEEYGYNHAIEILLFYPILGILAGLVAAFFVRSHFRVEDLVKGIRLPPALVPWIGGAIVGGAVTLSGGLLIGDGHLSISLDLFGRIAWWGLILLALGKILLTSLTLSTGGSGGVFTPSLYVGATIGGGFGVILADLLPSLTITPEAYALVGMGAVVAAATGAPLTGILIVFEMTDDSAIMMPLMLTVVIAYLVARRLSPDDLYSGWLRRRGQNLKHGTDRAIMADITVREACELVPVTIPATQTVISARDVSDQDGFPVTTADGRLVGMLTMREINRFAKEDQAKGVSRTVGELAEKVRPLAPEDTLLSGLRRMASRGASSLPVVDPATGQLFGLLSRDHALWLYERVMAETGMHAVVRGEPPRTE
ncbi:MAG: chloride channel protein [Gemmatimonadota bacterium]|nr:chloride channel protein [Gemmatimonadota bacterium]